MLQYHSRKHLTLFLLFLTLVLTASTPMSISAQEENFELHDTLLSEDAIILTLRIQEGIKLDTTLALEIDRVLDEAKSEYDTLVNIHACPEYRLYELILASNASWTQPWQEGELITGNRIIDSLSYVFQLDTVVFFYHADYFGWNGFLLIFAQPLNMPILAELYENVPGIEYACPNYIDRAMGCYTEIIAMEKENSLNIVFCFTSGGYPYYYAGHCWYFSVTENGAVQLIEEKCPDSLPYLYEPYIYRWNVPPYYAATVFNNVDELLSAAQFASEWWVRRHAVEVIGRLYKYDRPWTVGDQNYILIFEELREEIQTRKEEVYHILRNNFDDEDTDVKKSAQIALNMFFGYSDESLAFYYPLHVGNSWTFESTYGSYTETITDTQRIYGNLYFESDRFRYSPKVLFRMSYDNKLMMLCEEEEQVWLDFSADVGDTWPVTTPFGNSQYLVHLLSKEDSVSVPAGTFTHCYGFKFKCDDRYGEWYEWYAPGVGPIERVIVAFEVGYELLNIAIIDGIVMPKLKGDLDQNGELNVGDVVIVVNVIVNKYNPTPDQFWAADYNDDRSVNVLDVVEIIRVILGAG